MTLEPQTPRPEQESAIQELLAHKAHLCRGETGAGKTLIGVEAVLRTEARITLVVCPVNTFSSWKKTFLRQSGGTVLPRVIDTKLKAGKLVFEALVRREPGVYLVGWEKFRMYDWSKMPLDFTISDECHRQQNRKAANHIALMTTKHSEYKLALSATPWGNHIQGAWAAIRWLWFGRDDIVGRNDSFWNWVTMHMTTKRDSYSGKKVEHERVPGTVWASLPSKSFFPSPYQDQPIIHEILVPLVPAQRKIYDRFEQEAVVWLDEHPLVADLPSVMRVRLRQICLAVPSIRFEWQRIPDADLMEYDWDKCETEERENGWYAYKEVVYFEESAISTKADAMLDVISDLYAAGPVPILIFGHSEKFATMFTKRLQAKGYNALRFVGGMPTDEREWKKENFGKEFDIMVATIATVGEGTDGLQEVCNIEFWVSLEDNRLLNIQTKGRLSRPGQKKTVQRFMFLAENTVEVRQAGKLQADQEQLDASFTPLEEEVTA